MDLSDATKILLDRIQKLEPDIATKIMGCILIQDHGEREMIRLACAPEKFLENLVQKTKVQLGYLSKPQDSTTLQSPAIPVNPSPVSEVSLNYMPFSPNGSRPYSSPPVFQVPQAPSYWDVQPMAHEQQLIMNSDFPSYGDSVAEELCLQNQAQFMGIDDQMDSINGGNGSLPGDLYFADGALGTLRSCRSPNLSDLPNKMCHYFNRGFCKHGINCRYLHGPDSFAQIFSPNDFGPDDHILSPGSLEKLEIEISELIKSRRGSTVSIASLPMLYYEKYRRTLQAEGYLTESQRHGRAGFSLTKLLARLKRIRLIDRPHGQHAVILTEDASKYNVDNRSERNDPGPIVSGSRQIYLTFPAESTFTEEDVSNYFGTFGAVEDVRIPSQQKRMFGFVTFASANTAKTVLAKGNPHFVCGSRVLVKPYREKSKLVDRNYMEKNDHVPRCEAPRFLKRQLMEEQEAIEMERMRISELQLGHKNLINRQFISYGMEELNALKNDKFNFCLDHSNIPSAGQDHYLLDVFSNCNITDDRSKHQSNDFTDHERGLIFPRAPLRQLWGTAFLQSFRFPATQEELTI